jgi:hypothetical protein
MPGFRRDESARDSPADLAYLKVFDVQKFPIWVRYLRRLRERRTVRATIMLCLALMTATSGPVLAGRGNGGGGSAGTGGTGGAVTGATINLNTSTIAGGNGGTGGAGGVATGVRPSDGIGTGFGGNGGAGGIGALLTVPGATLTNSGTIQGGNGGPQAAEGLGLLLVVRAAPGGLGGAGIVGSGLTIINSATMTGGLGGAGARANAITFTGGSNNLTLQAGSTINGNIDVTGTLTFMQPTNATLANVVTGPGSIAKSGAGSLTLSGINPRVAPPSTPACSRCRWTIISATPRVGSPSTAARCNFSPGSQPMWRISHD